MGRRIRTSTALALATALLLACLAVPQMSFAAEAQDGEQAAVSAEAAQVQAAPVLDSFVITGTYDFDRASALLDALNAAREAKGLAPLASDGAHAEAAMQRAAELAIYYGGVRPDGSDGLFAVDGAQAQFVAAGEGMGAEAALGSWLEDEGLAAQLFSANASSAAIGCFRKGSLAYWALFATGNGQSAAPSGTRDVSVTVASSPALTTIEHIALSPSSQDGPIKLGFSQTLRVYGLLSNAGREDLGCVLDPRSFTWTSADDSVASMAGEGVVSSANTAGTTTIQAATASGAVVSIDLSVERMWKELNAATASACAQAISREGFQAADVCVLIGAKPTAGVLAAPALAGAFDAPILVSEKDALSPEAKAEIARLSVKNVILVGNEEALAASVEDELAGMGIACARIAGDTAAETSRLAADYVGNVWGGTSTVIVTTGSSFSDGLSAAPWSYANKAPVILTEKDGTLAASAITLLKTRSFKNALIVGGETAVSKDVETQLADAGLAVTRIEGEKATATSAAFAEWSLQNGSQAATVGLARSSSRIEALCASALLGRAKGVLLLTRASSSADAQAFIDAHSDEVLYPHSIAGAQL